MPAGPDDLFQRLNHLDIAHETAHHRAVHTVEEAQSARDNIAGGHSKNLFLRNKKKQTWLVCTLEDKPIDLKQMADQIGAGRFSFGSPDRLNEYLGVLPGSVTPFALINDPDARIKVVLDAAMLEHDQLNFHPLVNTMTTTISSADLLKFVRACGHEPLTPLL
jgi:Ala-tRNA(Pro) deacylase